MPISLKLRLPDPPPSVNHAWRMFKGRMIRSERFRLWEIAAIAGLLRSADGQKLPTVCYWRVDIAIPRGKTTCDIDNLPKAINDALKKTGITPDDRYLVDMRIRFWAGGDLLLTIHEAETEIWLETMAPSRPIAKQMRAHSTWTPRS